jgi:hypothetical protein
VDVKICKLYLLTRWSKPKKKMKLEELCHEKRYKVETYASAPFMSLEKQVEAGLL